MTISEQAFAEARASMERRRQRGYATAARYDHERKLLVVDLHTGKTLEVPIDWLQGLAGADPDKLAEIEITAGISLHWPALDADINVTGLLDGLYGSPSWMASLSKKMGGNITATQHDVHLSS